MEGMQGSAYRRMPIYLLKKKECPVNAGAGAWAAQQLDKELLKDEVRPSVVEEIRLQTDEEMRMLLANLKVTS